jgi:ABC-type glutathione transport system ATPase component
MTTSTGVLAVTRLSKSFTLKDRRSLVSVSDVTFELDAGESLGIVGESGSGKSTLARLIVGLESPTAGRITACGHDRTQPVRRHAERLRRAQEVQIVFQDPYTSLDSRQTARQCIVEVLKLHHASSTMARDSRAADLLTSVGLPERVLDQRPDRLSGGQRQRIAIARALAVEPEVLILDEAVSALDVSVQAQILNLLADIRDSTGTALLFISHDLAVVQQITSRALVMRGGLIVETGPTDELLSRPRHPYTQALLASIPGPGWQPVRLDRSNFDSSPVPTHPTHPPTNR